MKNPLPLSLIILVSMVFVSCTDRHQQAIDHLKRLEKEMAVTSGKPDAVKVARLTSAYRDFAVRYTTDTLTPAYLLKAGGLFMQTGNTLKAIESLEQVTVNYEASSQAPKALFLEGYIFETMLGDLKTAREIYGQFLVRYPKSDLADDARASLYNLGKTPEQITRELESAYTDSTEKAEK